MKLIAWQVLSGSELATELPVSGDPAVDSCRPYYPGDRCGGCVDCQLMQAVHYGYALRPIYAGDAHP